MKLGEPVRLFVVELQKLELGCGQEYLKQKEAVRNIEAPHSCIVPELLAAKTWLFSNY